MKDNIVNAITSDGAVRIVCAETTFLCNEAQHIHKTMPTATATLGRLLTAAAIMGSMMKSPTDSITLQLLGDGPIGRVLAVGNGKAEVKGYVENPLVDPPLNAIGKLDVRSAVGTRGMLSIIKDLGLKEPYIGQVPITSGEIAEDITYYYANSEQIPSAVALGVLVDTDYSVKKAGGFILQLLPGALDEDAAKIEKAISGIASITELFESGKSPRDIVEMLLSEYSIEYFDDIPTKYKCDCSRERTDRSLISIGNKELQKIIDEDGKAELSCHFCNTVYKYNKEQLKSLMK